MSSPNILEFHPARKFNDWVLWYHLGQPRKKHNSLRKVLSRNAISYPDTVLNEIAQIAVRIKAPVIGSDYGIGHKEHKRLHELTMSGLMISSM